MIVVIVSLLQILQLHRMTSALNLYIVVLAICIWYCDYSTLRWSYKLFVFFLLIPCAFIIVFVHIASCTIGSIVIPMNCLFVCSILPQCASIPVTSKWAYKFLSLICDFTKRFQETLFLRQYCFLLSGFNMEIIRWW